jgi:ABC-type bacteriocin/lantibiotic exporter with double-glycine peptidase domain
MIKYYRTFLNQKEKKIFILIIFFFLVLGFLELISLSLIIPILEILINGEKKSSLSNFLFFKDFDLNIKIILTMFISTIIIKNFFLILMTYINSKFIIELTNKIQSELIKNFLNKKLIDKNKQHSSKILRDITSEANLFSSGYVGPTMSSISQLILISFIILFLFIFNFKVTLVICTIILIISFLIKLFFGKILRNYGEKRVILSEVFFRTLKNCFDFAKEIKILNLMDYFTSQFNNNLNQQKKIGIKRALIAQLPRFILELSFSIFIIFYIFFNLTAQNSNLIIEIGVYVSCIFRIMPTVNGLFANYQKTKYSKNIYSNLSYLFEKKEITENFKNITFEKSIRLENVSFSFDNKNYLLENINLEIRKNSKIGIMGSSGSGKTTLINLIMGFIMPTHGRIFIDNQHNIYRNSKWLNLISYVPQNIVILDDDIKNNIVLFDTFRNFNYVNYKKIIEQTQLVDLEKKIIERGYKNLGEGGSKISFGEKQRIGLARALYRRSEILILDEPTNFLDRANVELFINTLEKFFQDKTVIILSHDKNVLRICEKTYNLVNRNLLSSSKSNFLK